MDEKTEFLVRLTGPKAYKRKLDDLFRQRRLLGLEIRDLVEDAYNSDPVLRDTDEDALNRMWHKGIFQLSLVAESECERSPYGMHAVSNGHQHHHTCVWCEKEVVDYTTDLEQV